MQRNLLIQRLRSHISLRWQLALFYVASLSAVLTLLGLLLNAEVERIAVGGVYTQLQEAAGPILASGQVREVASEKSAWIPFGMIWQSASHVPATAKACPPGSKRCYGPTAFSKGNPTVAAQATDGGDQSSVDLTLNGVAATDVVARFITTSGEVRGEAGSAPLAAALPVPSAQSLQYLPSSERLVVVSRNTRERVAVLLLPASTKTGDVGALELAASLQSVDHFLTLFRLSLLFGIFAALATGTAVSLVVTQRLLSPLDHMTGVSRAVAAGELQSRFQGYAGSKEVGTLATSFNHMMDQVEAGVRAQRQFTADAAHELRTPLTALGGSVELLLLGADEGDARRTQKMLRSMDREIQRLTRLVNDLLQLARLDGASEIDATEVDLKALVVEVAEELRLISPEGCVDVVLGPDVFVQGDGDRLKQVFLNLGVNAVQATPLGGRVALSVDREADTAVVQVVDTGTGIAADDLPHIFDRLYRSDPSRSRSSGSTGLGLAIARAIVQAHHGTICVESEIGRGSTFRVRLPAPAGASSTRTIEMQQREPTVVG